MWRGKKGKKMQSQVYQHLFWYLKNKKQGVHSWLGGREREREKKYRSSLIWVFPRAKNSTARIYTRRGEFTKQELGAGEEEEEEKSVDLESTRVRLSALGAGTVVVESDDGGEKRGKSSHQRESISTPFSSEQMCSCNASTSVSWRKKNAFLFQFFFFFFS